MRYLFPFWTPNQKMKQGFALSALIPMLGVTVGVFSFIVVLGVMSGFVENMKAELIRLTPHANIVSNNVGDSISAQDEFLHKIKAINPSEILAVTPYQIGDAILQSANQATLVSLNGVDPNTIESVIDIDDYIVIGDGLGALNQTSDLQKKQKSEVILPNVVIGRELALQLNLTVGSVITFVSILFDEGFGPLQMPVIVSGIYDTGRFYLDSKMAYVTLESANNFFSSPHQWAGVELKLVHPFQANSVIQKINKELKIDNLHADLWTKKNSALLKALFLEHIGMMVVMSMIILVGCFSITISLLLSLYRKTRELAILRGLGLTQKDLSKLYLAQGFAIGTIGVLVGLGFGLLTLYLVHNFHVPILSNAYSGEPLPVKINIFDILFVSLGSIFLATAAAFWPAFKVRRLNVVDVLAIRQ